MQRKAKNKFDRNHKRILRNFYHQAIANGFKYWLRLINSLKKSLRGVEPEDVILGWQNTPQVPVYLADYLAKVLLTANLLGQATFWKDLLDKGLKDWAQKQEETPAGLPFLKSAEAGKEAFEESFVAGVAWAEFASVPPLNSDSAYKFFKDKVPLTRVEFDKLDRLAKNEAFTIAGTENIALIGQVKEVAQKALREGMTQFEFQKETWELFDTAGITKTSRWHLETVFRTNISNAYNASRWEQMLGSPSEAVERFVPYLEYSTTGGHNVCEICMSFDGKIYRRDDPVWDVIYPPLHYNCECLVAPVSAFETIDEGIKASTVYPDMSEIQFKGPPSSLGRMGA